LRETLHAVRDFLTVDEAADLSAQLPVLIRGLFFEGWVPAKTPAKMRSVDQFLERVTKTFFFQRSAARAGRCRSRSLRRASAPDQPGRISSGRMGNAQAPARFVDVMTTATACPEAIRLVRKSYSLPHCRGSFGSSRRIWPVCS
jgi:hypothetical protein